MDIKKRLGVALLNRREELHPTQDQMAELCGMSLRQYRDLENGKSDPKLSTLEKLVKGCGICLDELMR